MAVLNGGNQVGCKKYKILATAGPSPFIFNSSNFTISFIRCSSVFALMFNIVQLLDGYKTTNDHVKGKLPNIIKQAGFEQINISQKFNTVLGTVEIFQIKQR